MFLRLVLVLVVFLVVTPSWVDDAKPKQNTDIVFAWGVLPMTIVEDSYGHYVSRKYFGVQVHLANQGESLATVDGFHVKTKTGDTIHSVPYNFVRGTIRKGQITG